MFDCAAKILNNYQSIIVLYNIVYVLKLFYLFLLVFAENGT